MARILAIDGGYRDGGITAQALDEAAAAVREAGAEVSVVRLREKRIEFCTNCRACTQAPGERRGDCPLSDEMAALLDQAEAADGFILASPVNYYNVTALTRRFLERLTCYGYWPWGAPAPKLRILKPSRRAVLITSSAMPSLLGRLATGALRALDCAASMLGAKTLGTLFIGLSSAERPALSVSDKKKARRLGELLAKN